MDKSDRLSRTASVAYTKGLLNNPGENNCFLNSAVQVLWHLDVFRRSFRELSGHFCVGSSCIFCALKVIFTQFQYSDEVALPPDALRKALADTFKDQQRFQLQDMDDAAECLENILNRLHFHFAMNERDEICNVAHCISHRKFAMEIMEQTICNCGATSEPLPFFQLVHYVSVSALCHEAEVLSSKMKPLNQDNFGHLLKRAVNQGDTRDCPGNCGKRISVQQSLLNCPDVVCIGLIWDSDSPDIEQISQLLHCIDPVLRLPEVFPRVSDDKAKKVELLLAGVVTYYGKHYSTFFFSNKMKTWIYFDDARVRKCGSDWERIRDKCCQNHYQPLLLLYVNPHGRAVNTKSAPTEVKVVDAETLLAGRENSWNREKTKDLIGGVTSDHADPKRKLKSVESDDVLLSSSSTHSLSSDRGSERDLDMSASDQKKRRRPIKKLRTIGSDIKRVLSRSRNSSPIQELPDNESLSVLNEDQSEKKSNSQDDLIDLSDDARRKPIMALYTQGRELDETDSGLGSGGSQASSPATSSVSSVDTNTEDLIDFTTKNFPRSGKGDLPRVDSVLEEAENLLKRSHEFEKSGDLAMALSQCANASTRFRMVIEKSSSMHNPAFLTKLKNKHNMCLERARSLHQKITAEKEAKNRRFSQEKKEQLLVQQREREQEILRQHKPPPPTYATIPRSSTHENGILDNGIVPMSSRSISEVYLKNDHAKPEPPSSTVRRATSRNHCSSNIGTSRKAPDIDYREGVYCTQRIKPDILCYSPVHYGKASTLCSDFDRLNVSETSSHDRHPTVTHVSTSFIPVRSLPIEQTLLTSSAYASPNSRTVTDVRRCSIYDNMPPGEDRRKALAVPARTALSSPCPNDPTLKRVTYENNNDRSRAWTSPAYVDPPPYDGSRTISGSSNVDPATYDRGRSGIAGSGDVAPYDRARTVAAGSIDPSLYDRGRTGTASSVDLQRGKTGTGSNVDPPPYGRDRAGTAGSFDPSLYDRGRTGTASSVDLQRGKTGTGSNVDPPLYDRGRTGTAGSVDPSQYGRGRTGTASNQPGSLLQRFNVPHQLRFPDTVTGLPDDIRRLNKEIRGSRALCQHCHGSYVDKNSSYCSPCLALNSMLHDLNGESNY